MAEIAIWPGSSSFGLVSDPTPFGFYDYDDAFREDSDRVAQWCVQRLGYPLVDVELQDINLYSCFEEAVNEYGAQVYNATIIYNFGSLIKTSTGSALNNIVIDSNYGSTTGDGIVSSAATIGNAGTSGVRGRTYSGSIDIRQGQQWYDLYDPATGNSTVAHLEDSLGNYIATSGSITITRIYHEAPAAINRYFDPYAGTGTGIQSLMQSFGFGNYSPGVNFMLMPMYFDILKLQAIELNDTIRKSSYHYEIEQDQYLKLFPIPTRTYKLWFEYTITLGSLGAGADPAQGLGSSAALNTVTDISNVPYDNPTYSFINAVGRQWIRKYTLALAKEMLGGIRGKYQSLPIPGETTTLDYSRLLSEAASEKESLIVQLREDLGELTTEKLTGRILSETENTTNVQSAEGRYQIYIH